MRKILLLSMTLFIAMAAWSQAERPEMCHSDEQMKMFYKQNPAAKQQAIKFEEQMRSRKNATARTGGYTIPVVFHIFGNDFAGATVDNNTIITALQKVNEDFHGLNDDYGTVSSLFQGIRATLDIEFKLAKIDPSGNPTTGINYYPERAGFGNGGGYDDQIRQFAWDNYKYMNVYIMLDLYDDNSYTNSGVAWYPDTWMSDNNLARVVYNGRYLYGNTDKEFASVLTHEFGHWLNLAHTFDNECKAPGDNVDDTPATTSNYGTCNVTTEKCSGAGIPNAENYMDYSDCYKMFTQGQVARMVAALDHAARFPLWQDTNLTATGVNTSDAPFLAYSAAILHEDDANEGGIAGSVTITAQNGAQFAAVGQLTPGTHFTTANVPAGLSVQINVQNSTTATLSVAGSTSAHADANDVSNISISFLDPAISGGTASVQNPTFNGFSLDFNDPYAIVYNDIADITASSSATWTFFDLGHGDGRYGCWYDGGKLRLETYQKPLICEGTTRNISLLSAGTSIGTTSNWVNGGAYPDEHDLRSSSFTTWDGKTGYIGFKFANASGKNLHGWFRVTVDATGSSFTLHDYAYYTKPEGTITAGATSVSTPPAAAFAASATTITAGQSVSFSDESTGGPTSWSWSFPGGTPATSTEQNPTVVYNAAGTYDVQLTVSNADGSDTQLSSGHITVNPATVSYCSSAGSRSTYEHIANVSVGGFSNASGAANYTDFSTLTVAITKGSNSITLTPGFSGSSYSEYFRVWIDYNQDGDFTDAGELAFDAGAASPAAVSGSIDVPSSALEGTTRMRVSMKYLSAPEPCGLIGDGEVEDYTVNITDAAPATYCAADAGSPSGQYIKNVKIGDINNNSTYNPGGYADYTGISTSIGTSATLSVTPHHKWAGTAARAWVDWNNDGDFDDSGEQVLSGSGNAASSYSTIISVPAGTAAGAHRLRIRVAYDATPTPCGSIWFSETEDYTLNTGSAAGPVASVPENELLVFPNPSENNQFQLKYPLTEGGLKVKVYNLQGSTVYQETIHKEQMHGGSVLIRLNQKVQGTYLVQVQNKDSIVVKKIIFK